MRCGRETSFISLTRSNEFRSSFYQFRREDIKKAGCYEQAIYVTRRSVFLLERHEEFIHLLATMISNDRLEQHNRNTVSKMCFFHRSI